MRSYPKPQHSLVRSRKVQVVVWVGLSVHSVASVKLFCRVLHIAAVLCQFYALQWCCTRVTRSARGRLQKDREGGQVPVICDNVGPWESRLEKPQLFVSANIQCPSCSSCSSGSQQVPEALVTSRAIHRIPALDISSGRTVATLDQHPKKDSSDPYCYCHIIICIILYYHVYII